MMKEFSSTISEIRKLCPTAELILMGDFNLPKIKWNIHPEIPGALSPTEDSQLSLVEEKFINIISKHCLHQINNTVNSDRKALDLIFVTQILNGCIIVPESTELLDRNSRHHSAVALSVTYLSQNKQSSAVIKTITRINDRSATEQLKLTVFNLFDDSELQIDVDEHY